MSSLSRRTIEAVESILPRVRRRRNAYARIDERIDEQRANDPAVPIGTFRCDRCERVQSRFAVGGLAEADTTGRSDGESGDETHGEIDVESELWCVECIEHREKVVVRLDRTPGLGATGRD